MKNADIKLMIEIALEASRNGCDCPQCKIRRKEQKTILYDKFKK